MATPYVDPFQRASYPDLREVAAAVAELEAPTAQPVRLMANHLGTAVLACLRAAHPRSITAATVASRTNQPPRNVSNWLKQSGPRHGVIVTGEERQRPRVRAEKLYTLDEQAMEGGE